jgi:hypothetical protein
MVECGASRAAEPRDLGWLSRRKPRTNAGPPDQRESVMGDSARGRLAIIGETSGRAWSPASDDEPEGARRVRDGGVPGTLGSGPPRWRARACGSAGS